MTIPLRLLRCLFCCAIVAVLPAAETDPRPALSLRAADGALVYLPDAAGNQVVDFSHAGYGGGGEAIPFVPAAVVVAPSGRDDHGVIQAAIDRVAAIPAGPDGFRGAVVLRRGRYALAGTLRLHTSGVVLRGSGEGENGTVLVSAAASRRTLIEIGGRGARTEVAGSRTAVADAFVPVGARTLRVADPAGLAPGVRVIVRRPATAAWIAAIGMNTMPGWRSENRIQWAPNSRDLTWDRTVTGVNGDEITLDAPLTTALDRTIGGGSVARYEFPGRIARVGVEQLRCVSAYDPAFPKDEEHAWVAVSLDQVEHAWVRQVTALHFVGSVVNAQADSIAVTIEDCTALDPVSELGGYRRRVFVVGGQLTLVQRCVSERGLRDFTTGFAAPGPNVFLHCTAREALGPSGPVESWASGVLYDNVIIRGDALRFLNRGMAGQGAGWTTANSVLWNCEATELQVQSPPGALNQAYGCKGLIVDDAVAYDPRWMPFRDYVRGGAVPPASLYLAQLAARKGSAAIARLARTSLSTATGAAPLLAAADIPALEQPKPGAPLRIEGARFMIGGERAWTGTTGYSWYLGQMPRPLARGFGPAITRFAPGETGPGATDILEDVVARLPAGGVFNQHYGLWYDRRRINHNFYGSPELSADDVTPPFMEMPWARSGVGRDWNGLSKYDLTRFNPWYFSRLKEFADLCDRHGRILQHSFYFQHALQETRAHYVDFPWRPVNCIQATDMPDENPAGSAFYDISHPVRRDLHRRYIRHCLDVLKANANVVHAIDREYSGPLAFVQFWLDTIAEWERENGKKVFIALEVPKAVMDAILDDPVRGRQITAIDFHHWFYRPDGSLFAIEGGINQAPREQNVGILPAADVAALQARVNYPGNIVNAPEFQRLAQTVRAGTPALRYRAVREYRDAYPDLVIQRRNDEFPALTAAIERAIPREARARTRPAALVRNEPATAWCMAARGEAYLVYTMAGAAVTLDMSQETGRFALAWLDAAAGGLRPTPELVTAGAPVTLTPPVAEAKQPWVAWLVRR
ncbi:DUF6298 domain-containing protein [Horticoccus sp. 23ND18S-11]|uniref:DUF6298 domain-containing protein n=1 Tax=Horticoccus sp. 23ND18S-11 TaxID=3391832 RepID=UPI0039C9340B